MKHVFQVRLHMGMGAGKLSMLHIGGEENRWEFLLIGEPLVTLGPAVGGASPDQVPIVMRLARLRSQQI